jgi:hypothetical protein
VPANEKPGPKEIDISVDRMTLDNDNNPKEYSASKLRSYLLKVAKHFTGRSSAQNQDS